MSLHSRFISSLIVCSLIAFGACRANEPADDPSVEQRQPARAAAARASGTDHPRRPSTTAPRVVALGDSLTAGLGLAESQAYPAILQKKIDDAGLGFEVVNAGVSGDTTAGGLRRLDWALEGNVRVLLVALGANDGLRGLPVQSMKQNLSRIIERAKARDIVVVLAGMEAPPNYGPEYTAGYRTAFRELAREHQVPFIPFLLDKVAGQRELNQGDGIHPNPRGAAVMADIIWGTLEPVLREISTTS